MEACRSMIKLNVSKTEPASIVFTVRLKLPEQSWLTCHYFHYYFFIAQDLGAVQRKKNSNNPRLLRKWVGGSRSHSAFFFKSSQNGSKPVLIFWSSIPYVFCLYTLLKVVSYYDLSVLSMSVMGFQKKVLMGGGWVG